MRCVRYRTRGAHMAKPKRRARRATRPPPTFAFSYLSRPSGSNMVAGPPPSGMHSVMGGLRPWDLAHSSISFWSARAWSSVTIGFALLGTWTMTAPDPETLDLSHRGFQAMMKAGLDPMHPNWIAGEIAAFGDGPFLDAMAYRGMTFVSYVVISVFSVYWHIIGMAIIGSWLHDRDFFSSAGARLQRLFINTLLPVGLVLSIACGISFWYREDHPVVASIMTGIQMVSASMIALGIVGLVTILVVGDLVVLAISYHLLCLLQL